MIIRIDRILIRFNKIAIQARAETAADKEAVGLSRVHMYESKCILPLNEIIVYSVLKDANPIGQCSPS